jgi:hypothetical protein
MSRFQRRRGRHLMAAWVGLLLAASVAAPVAAKAPIRSSSIDTSFFCEESLVGGQGSAQLYFAGLFVDASGMFFGGELSIQTDASDPQGTNTFGEITTGTFDGTHYEASAEMVADADGLSRGTATIAADFAFGPAEPFAARERIGNFWQISEGTDEPALVSGEITFAGDTFPFADCPGSRHAETSFQTSPNATQVKLTFTDLHCQVDLGGGDVAFIDLFGGGAAGSIFFGIDPAFISGAADVAYSFDGDAIEIDAAMPSFDDTIGEPVADSHVAARFEPDGPAISEYLPRRSGYEKSTFQVYSVEGSLDVPAAGVTVDLSSCQFVLQDLRAVSTNSRGPSAPRPVNDTPDGAIALERGASVSLRTGGASDGELDTTCLESPFGQTTFSRTVWYTVEGDGSEMTIDTAGSDFDTVIAVYVEMDLGNGPELVEVACVDDVFGAIGRDIHASLTGPTEAGVTYWVQIGGWNNAWGTLRVSVS